MDDHQMWQGIVDKDPCLGGGDGVGPKLHFQQEGVLYHVTYPMVHLMLPIYTHPTVNRHTHVKTYILPNLVYGQ